MSKIKNEGRQIAIARDKFFQENHSLLETQTEGQFLKNRLEIAFIAGWNAAKQKLNVGKKTKSRSDA